MKKILVSVFLVLLIQQGVEAQRRNGLIGHRRENSGLFTFAFGPAYCFDDPFGSEFSKSVLDGQNFHTALGYQHFFANSDIGYRAQLHYARFTGEDTSIKSHQANTWFYAYESNVFEFSARAEYNLTFGKKFRRSIPNTIYGFLGAGVLSSNPKFYSDAPGKQGPHIAAFIPFGVGYKYQFTPQISMGAELGEQIVFSDFVDGYEGSHIPGVRVVNDNIGAFSVTFYYKLF